MRQITAALAVATLVCGLLQAWTSAFACYRLASAFGTSAALFFTAFGVSLPFLIFSLLSDE